MPKKILLFGATGKLGRALNDILRKDYNVVGISSKDCDACDISSVEEVVVGEKPDILINAAAMLGLEPCEEYPDKAISINTFFPKLLASLSQEHDFLLVHFSTDAVFDGEKRDFYIESDLVSPLNIYGLTKFGGESFIHAIAERYYIFRLPLLFGETGKTSQFVERMLDKLKKGARSIKVSTDAFSTPTYSYDAAREAKRIIEAGLEFGLYHVANEGKCSLYDLMTEIARNLRLSITVEKGLHKDFASPVLKSTYGALKSERIASLRPWKEALSEYCSKIQGEFA